MAVGMYEVWTAIFLNFFLRGNILRHQSRIFATEKKVQENGNEKKRFLKVTLLSSMIDT